MSKPKFYVVEVFGGIEPSLSDPFHTADERDESAKLVHAEQDPETDATFWLDVDEDGVVELGSYSGLFFADIDE